MDLNGHLASHGTAAVDAALSLKLDARMPNQPRYAAQDEVHAADRELPYGNCIGLASDDHNVQLGPPGEP